MATVVPQPMISIPDHSQVIAPDGAVVTIGSWVDFQHRMVDGVATRINPTQIMARVVPSEQDAILAILAHFEIAEVKVIHE